MITETAPPLNLYVPDGYPAPDAMLVAAAAELLRSIQGVAARQQVRWEDPLVASSEEGEIDLYFHVGTDWLILTVEPGDPTAVLLTAQRDGGEPHVRRRTAAEAANEVASLLPPRYEVPVRECP